jgi:hypothetical protein
MLTLIETNDLISSALSKHQRALYNARKATDASRSPPPDRAPDFLTGARAPQDGPLPDEDEEEEGGEYRPPRRAAGIARATGGDGYSPPPGPPPQHNVSALHESREQDPFSDEHTTDAEALRQHEARAEVGAIPSGGAMDFGLPPPGVHRNSSFGVDFDNLGPPGTATKAGATGVMTGAVGTGAPNGGRVEEAEDSDDDPYAAPTQTASSERWKQNAKNAAAQNAQARSPVSPIERRAEPVRNEATVDYRF